MSAPQSARGALDVDKSASKVRGPVLPAAPWTPQDLCSAVWRVSWVLHPILTRGWDALVWAGLITAPCLWVHHAQGLLQGPRTPPLPPLSSSGAGSGCAPCSPPNR